MTEKKQTDSAEQQLKAALKRVEQLEKELKELKEDSRAEAAELLPNVPEQIPIAIAARRLNIHPVTMYRQSVKRHLTLNKFGKNIYITEEQVLKYLELTRVKSGDELSSDEDDDTDDVE